MKKTLIFGTGSTGRRIYDELKSSCNIIGFLDNDPEKWGGMWMVFLFLEMHLL